MKTYIRLGSGESRFTRTSSKARLLDRALQAGLPVPRGVIIPETTYHRVVKRGLINIRRDRIKVPSPDDLMVYLDLPRYAEPAVAVRSAAVTPESVGEEVHIQPRLFIDSSSAGAMARALQSIWESVLQEKTLMHRRFSHDVLVMTMVNARHTGFAFSEVDYEDDLIYLSADEEYVPDELEASELHPLPALRKFEQQLLPDGAFAWMGRLQRLLRDVRRTFGDKDWKVIWADDGERCWLVELYLIIQKPPRREQFISISQHADLPALPSRLTVDLLGMAGDDIYHNLRRMDRRLPANRPVVETFHGYPYFNLSLMMDMLRRLGQSTRRLTDWLELESPEVGRGDAASVTDYAARPRRQWRHALVYLRYRTQRFMTPFRVRRLMKQVESYTIAPGLTFTACMETLHRIYSGFLWEMFMLNGQLYRPGLSLERQGVLDEHRARLETPSTRIYSDLNALRTLVRENPDLIEGRTLLEDDETFQQAWRIYLGEHGHRALNELDIASPRFRDHNSALIMALLVPPRETPRPPRTLAGLLTWPLWWRMRRLILLRENLRSVVMKGLLAIRDRLLELADEVVKRGQLPGTEALWLLTTGEVCGLDTGWTPHPEILARRELEQERYALYKLPTLLYSDSLLENYRGEK